MAPELFVITGVMAAGKSTVAGALAARLDHSVHVRGDQFRRFIVSGRADMSAEPSAEALDQLHLRYRLAAQCAEAYVDAGFTVVLQDVMLGPMLSYVLDQLRTRPLALVVLAPSVAAIEVREAERAKVGYGGVTPEQLDRVLREQTPPIGLWIDSSEQTPDETVQHLLDNLDAALI